MNKLKLYLLKKLFIWWINNGNGRELRGTQIEDKIFELLFQDKIKDQ